MRILETNTGFIDYTFGCISLLLSLIAAIKVNKVIQFKEMFPIYEK